MSEIEELKKRNKNLKKISIVTGAVAVGSTILAVLLSKENNKVVTDYNKLVDKTRYLSDFIDKHDFYERLDSTKKKKNTSLEHEFQTISEEKQSDGLLHKVVLDTKTGFTVYSCEKMKGDEVKEG